MRVSSTDSVAEMRARGRHGFALTSEMEESSSKTLASCVGKTYFGFLETYRLLCKLLCVEAGFYCQLEKLWVLFKKNTINIRFKLRFVFVSCWSTPLAWCYFTSIVVQGFKALCAHTVSRLLVLRCHRARLQWLCFRDLSNTKFYQVMACKSL